MAPAWSPDGKWIAYLAEPRYMEGDIRIVAADGRSPATAITSGIGAQRVQWFGQDGRSLMVVALWGGSRLEARVIDREGRPVSSAPHAVDLGENLELPDFELSRDGRWMIFARDERQGDLLLLDTRFPRR
jgi:hypothetical protein